MIVGNNNEQNIRNNTCNGNCSRCGDCCGLFIPFNDKDIKVIKQYVKKNNIKPYDRLNKMTGVFEARCCFYNVKDKKCMIYPVRPYVCQDFICNRKNWKQRRNDYEKNCKYNSTKNKMILATFDDKIFSDYGPIILYFLMQCRDKNGVVDSDILIKALNRLNRNDLLLHFSAIDEKGNKVKGCDL